MATVQQIKQDLAKKVVKAMEAVKIQVRDIIYRVCMEYYGEYNPRMYSRTYQIARAIYDMASASVKGRMVGASFEIYIDSSMFNHIKDDWDEERILAGVMLGGEDSHGGAKPGGTAVWTESMNQIDGQIMSIVKRELIAAGIPIH